MAAVVLCLAASSCGTPDPGSTPRQPAGVPVLDVVRVVRQAPEITLSMPGELAPFEMVAIYPKVSGYVKSIRVDRGSPVRAGDVIAVLDAPELAAQRAEAQSRLEVATAQLAAMRAKAEADLSTYERLHAASATPGVVAGNDVVVAQKALEGSRSQAQAAQQGVEAAKEAARAVRDLENYLRVTAPFDGVVTERNVHPGALVGPNSGPAAAVPIVRIVQNRRLRLVVPIPEAYTAGIIPGTLVSFTVAGHPGEAFSGRVARIAQSVDVKTRTMPVELDVANENGRLTNGSFCQVRWPVRRASPSLFVPTGSVASTTDRVFVVRITNGRTEWIDVRTGLTSGPLVEVFGALHAGDEVAARGTDEMKPGTEVRPRDVSPST